MTQPYWKAVHPLGGADREDPVADRSRYKVPVRGLAEVAGLLSRSRCMLASVDVLASLSAPPDLGCDFLHADPHLALVVERRYDHVPALVPFWVVPVMAHDEPADTVILGVNFCHRPTVGQPPGCPSLAALYQPNKTWPGLACALLGLLRRIVQLAGQPVKEFDGNRSAAIDTHGRAEGRGEPFAGPQLPIDAVLRARGPRRRLSRRPPTEGDGSSARGHPSPPARAPSTTHRSHPCTRRPTVVSQPTSVVTPQLGLPSRSLA